jgi:methionyl aminopeptidase
MTIGSEDELEKLKAAGRVVANVLKAMGEALEPGVTTRELDDLGRRLLDA